MDAGFGIRVLLPATLDRSGAIAVIETLRAVPGADWDLDGSAVERCGRPGVEALLSAADRAARAGARFRIRAPSPALAAAFADLGLAGDLDGLSDPGPGAP
jgi:anti-anti-sigma regulatory factor